MYFELFRCLRRQFVCSSECSRVIFIVNSDEKSFDRLIHTRTYLSRFLALHLTSIRCLFLSFYIWCHRQNEYETQIYQNELCIIIYQWDRYRANGLCQRKQVQWVDNKKYRTFTPLSTSTLSTTLDCSLSLNLKSPKNTTCILWNQIQQQCKKRKRKISDSCHDMCERRG